MVVEVESEGVGVKAFKDLKRSKVPTLILAQVEGGELTTLYKSHAFNFLTRNLRVN